MKHKTNLLIVFLFAFTFFGLNFVCLGENNDDSSGKEAVVETQKDPSKSAKSQNPGGKVTSKGKEETKALEEIQVKLDELDKKISSKSNFVNYLSLSIGLLSLGAIAGIGVIFFKKFSSDSEKMRDMPSKINAIKNTLEKSGSTTGITTTLTEIKNKVENLTSWMSNPQMYHSWDKIFEMACQWKEIKTNNDVLNEIKGFGKKVGATDPKEYLRVCAEYNLHIDNIGDAVTAWNENPDLKRSNTDLQNQVDSLKDEKQAKEATIKTLNDQLAEEQKKQLPAGMDSTILDSFSKLSGNRGTAAKMAFLEFCWCASIEGIKPSDKKAAFIKFDEQLHNLYGSEQETLNGIRSDLEVSINDCILKGTNYKVKWPKLRDSIIGNSVFKKYNNEWFNIQGGQGSTIIGVRNAVVCCNDELDTVARVTVR